MVTVGSVQATTDALLNPDDAAWRQRPNERITLIATPLSLQPSEYVQNKWASLGHGGTPEVRVRALHNRESIFFRMEWDDATDDSQPNDMASFPDQAGVMLPIADDAVITEMGGPGQPVNMWLWRPDLDRPLYVTAAGRGTTRRQTDSPLAGSGTWRNGTWHVVISRPFNVGLPAALVVPLAPGMTHKCTFAVWQGDKKERGGLKAYQPAWQPLEIEA